MKKHTLFYKLVYESYKKDIDSQNKYKIRIFSRKFVNNNKSKCKLIYRNKEYDLKEYFEDIEQNYNKEENIKIKLKFILNIVDLSKMFEFCNHLLSMSDSIKKNKERVIPEINKNCESDNQSQTLFEEIYLSSLHKIEESNNLYTSYDKLSFAESSIQKQDYIQKCKFH